MGEIIDRLLLVAFSCVILVLTFSTIIPVMSDNIVIFSNISDKRDQIEEISTQLSDFEKRVTAYKNSDSNLSQVFDFDINLNFTGFLLKNTSAQVALRFIFYFNSHSTPIFRDIQFNFYIDIEFQTVLLNKYNLSAQNNSISLRLY